MKADPARRSAQIKALGAIASGLKARLRVARDATAIAAGDLVTLAAYERQAKDRREGRLTVANRKHAHGARAEIHGYLSLDDYALTGLEQHGLLYALWLGKAALENPDGNLGSLLAIILSDLQRASWCRAEGARVSWEFAKSAREAETADFLRRRHAGTLGNWRPKPLTERQHYLITLICTRADIAYPVGLNRGRGYDWIQARGAHPKFWAPPPPPPEWPDPKNHLKEVLMTTNDIDGLLEAFQDGGQPTAERDAALRKALASTGAEIAGLEAKQDADALSDDDRRRLALLRRKEVLLRAALGAS